jgi:8-oxo-dGTP pyrophosphatase MutT (NUDIX family)
MDSRPEFTYRGQYVKAAGVLPYCKDKFLFIRPTEKPDEIEPFGGKSDEKDTDIQDIAIREAREESNGILQFTKDQLTNCVYFPASKYLLFFVDINDCDPEQFGTKELHDNIPRTVQWLTYDEIVQYKSRKIDKKILLTKIRFILDPDREKLLVRKPEVKSNQLLLSWIFDGFADAKIMMHCLESDLDVNIKIEGNLYNLVYREALDLWTNTIIPYKIQFMNENRGTIYEYKDNKFTCVCLPLEKFWQHEHPLRAHSKFDHKTICWVKHDGYIMKLFWYNNKWNVATNSESDAVNATLRNTNKNARTIFDECAAAVGLDWSVLDKNYCYVFEMVHPECRLVVPYEKPCLYHLTSRDMRTLRENLDIDIKVPKPEILNISSEDECLGYIADLHFTKGEGIVVCDTGEYYNGRSYSRVKYKSPSYNREHKLLETTPETKERIITEHIVDYWLTGQYELVEKYHPELKEYLRKFTKKLEDCYDEVITYYKANKSNKIAYFKNLPKNKLISFLLAELYRIPDVTDDNIVEHLNVLMRQKKHTNYMNRQGLLVLNK